MRDSGMFYESHLARWFGGEYPLEELLREPQGRLSHLRLPDVHVQAESMAKPVGAAMKSGSMEAMESMVKLAGGTDEGHDGVVNRQALPVVREQLETLQSGQLVYRGDLFPGQQMEWNIQERDAGKRQKGKEERAWESGLELDFPALGQIKVQLSLEGKRVGISISTVDPASAEILGAGKMQLAEQLEVAGLLATGIGVRHVVG